MWVKATLGQSRGGSLASPTQSTLLAIRSTTPPRPTSDSRRATAWPATWSTNCGTPRKRSVWLVPAFPASVPGALRAGPGAALQGSRPVANCFARLPSEPRAVPGPCHGSQVVRDTFGRPVDMLDDVVGGDDRVRSGRRRLLRRIAVGDRRAAQRHTSHTARTGGRRSLQRAAIGCRRDRSPMPLPIEARRRLRSRLP